MPTLEAGGPVLGWKVKREMVRIITLFSKRDVKDGKEMQERKKRTFPVPMLGLLTGVLQIR